MKARNNMNEEFIHQEVSHVTPIPRGSIRKKSIIFTICILAFITLAAILFFVVFKPKVELDIFIKENIDTDKINVVAQEYDKQDITFKTDTRKVVTGFLALEIPSRYQPLKNNVIYEVNEDEGEGHAIFAKPTNFEGSLNVPKDGKDSSTYLGIGPIISNSQLENGIKALTGIPADSALNTYRLIFSLTEKDYNFFSSEQQVAYCIMAIVKLEVMSNLEDHESFYIVEKDDLCIFVSHRVIDDKTIEEYEGKGNKPAKYQAIIDVFSKEEPDKSAVFAFSTNDTDELYALVSSIRTLSNDK